MVEPLRSFVAAELWSLIAFQLISKRMDDAAKEVGDADGVYVMLEYRVGEGCAVLQDGYMRRGCTLS